MFKGDFSKWSALQKAARHVSPGGKKQKRPLIDSPENILTLEKAAAKQKTPPHSQLGRESQARTSFGFQVSHGVCYGVKMQENK